jgi:hypothetical protein
MRSWWFAAGLVACGGDGGRSDSATGDDDDDDGTVPIECNLPGFDIDVLSCDQLASAWRQTVDAGAACNQASECVVLRASCEQWYQIECFHATNASCVGPDQMAAYNSAGAGCTTGGDACICGPEPAVDCVNHVCTIVGASE